MTNEQEPMQASVGEESARGVWVQPLVHRMIVGGADSGGDTSVDGSGTLS